MDEWQTLADTFSMTSLKERETRDATLTGASRPRTANDQVGSFLSDILADLSYGLSTNASFFTMWQILTAGDRGVILGTLFVIISLALLALR
jgi:hypothetical protein